MRPPSATRAAYMIARREAARHTSGARGAVMAAGAASLHALMFHALALGLRARPAAALLQDAYAIAFVLCTLCALLIGMRTFAHERERGGMAALDALPISTAALVAGKMAGALLALLPVQLCALPSALMLAQHGDLSWAQLMTCALGLMLAQCAALAVALCASAASAAQLGAALAGGAALAALLLTWWLARLVPPPLDAALAALSLYDRHLRAFTEGRVRLQDVAYYTNLSALALCWATLGLRLRRRRGRPGAAHLRAAAAGIIALAVVGGAQAAATRWDHVWAAQSAGATPSAQVMALRGQVRGQARVTLFLPATSDIQGELSMYFGALLGPDAVQLVDQRAEPALAAQLGVEDNGVAALWVEGGGVERLLVGERRVDATLRGLDREVERALMRLKLGPRTIYVLGGHGELDRRQGSDERGRAVALWEVWEQGTGADIAALELGDGSAQAVPADAAFVAVLGPKTALREAETRALVAYLDAGGSLLLALDGSSPEASAWAERLGWRLGAGALCAERSILPTRLALSDRRELITRSFAVTPALGPLGEPGGGAVLWPQSVWWEEGGAAGRAQAVIYSPPDSWAEVGAECVRDEASEPQGRRAAGLLWSGAGRVALLGSAQALADVGLVRGQGNRLLALSLARWLMDPAAPATGRSAEEQPVTLSAETRRRWLWGTALLWPSVLLASALLWSRRGRR